MSWLPGMVRYFAGKTVGPAVTDDLNKGFEVSDVWIDEVADVAYQCLDNTVGAAVWSAGGGSTYTVNVLDDANKTLVVAELNEVYLMNSASARIINLPSVDATDVGKWLILVKAGAGKLTINAADSDTIADSTAGGSIECNEGAVVDRKIGLRLITATEWELGPECFGVWSTR